MSMKAWRHTVKTEQQNLLVDSLLRVIAISVAKNDIIAMEIHGARVDAP